MLSIVRRPDAKADLINIWLTGFGRWGETQADAYFSVIESAFDRIAENPKIGITCDYIRQGYRQYPIKSHIIFYRVDESKIEIVRVLRDNMDFKRHL